MHFLTLTSLYHVGLLVSLAVAVGLGYYLTQIAPEPLLLQDKKIVVDFQKKLIATAAGLFGLWQVFIFKFMLSAS